MQSDALSAHRRVVAGRDVPVIPHHLQFEAQEVQLFCSFAGPSIAEGAVAGTTKDIGNFFSAPDRVLDDVFP